MPDPKQSPDGPASAPAAKPEPLAAILAEMRNRADTVIDGRVITERNLVPQEVIEDWSDRIEAAYKREHAEWHAETNAAKDARNRIACKMRYEFAAKCRACKAEHCNSAALREALEEVLDKIDAWRTDGSMEHWQYSQLFDICDAALAAPPRNCDVGDAAEQSERLAKFCKANYEKAKKDKHICSECRFNDCIGECPLNWAQLPFTPEKGGAE